MLRAAVRKQANSGVPSDDEETFVDIDSIQSAIEDNNLQKLKGLMLDIPVESRHPTCMGPHNDTPLGFAAGHNHVSIVRWLLSDDVGADINAQDSRGSTPLMSACEETNTKVVKELLEARPDVNLVNQKGYTALHIACRNGHNPLVKTLLSHNAEPKTVNKQSETPLMAAAVAGHKACVKALLADPMLGASASMTQDSLGRTALMVAVLEGHAEAAKLLLESGVSPDVKSKNGLAIDIALDKGHQMVVTAIRQGVPRIFPLMGINSNIRSGKVSRGISKPNKGRGRKGVTMANGDFYEDIPYFD